MTERRKNKQGTSSKRKSARQKPSARRSAKKQLAPSKSWFEKLGLDRCLRNLLQQVGYVALKAIAKKIAAWVVAWLGAFFVFSQGHEVKAIRAVFWAQLLVACLMVLRLQASTHPERHLFTVFAGVNALYYAPLVAADVPLPISGVIGVDLRELAFLLMSCVLVRADLRRRGDRSFPTPLALALLLGLLTRATGESDEMFVSCLVSAFGAYAAARYGWTVRAELSILARICGGLYVAALLFRPLILESESLLVTQVYYSCMIAKWAVLERLLRSHGTGPADVRPMAGGRASDDQRLRLAAE